MGYEIEYSTAINRAKDWGVYNQSVTSLDVQRYLTPTSLAKVGECLQSATGHLSPKQVSAQCFALCSFLREPLEKALNLPLTYTVGYIEIHKNKKFYSPLEDLKSMLDTRRVDSHQFKLHAWLTLPSLEIIDPTLCTTFGVVQNDKRQIGGVIFNHPDDLLDGLSFHPQLVGEDYFRCLGVMIDF